MVIVGYEMLVLIYCSDSNDKAFYMNLLYIIVLMTSVICLIWKKEKKIQKYLEIIQQKLAESRNYEWILNNL